MTILIAWRCSLTMANGPPREHRSLRPFPRAGEGGSAIQRKKASEGLQCPGWHEPTGGHALKRLYARLPEMAGWMTGSAKPPRFKAI